MGLQRFERLKQQADTLQRDVSRAEGALEQLKKDIKKEFDCDTIKAAEALLKKLEWDAQQAEEKFDKALADFEEQFGELLK